MTVAWSIVLPLILRYYSLHPPNAIYWEYTNGLVQDCSISIANVGVSPVMSSNIHLREISSEIPQPSIDTISLKITYLKSYSNLPRTNEWTHLPLGDLNEIFVKAFSS